MTNVKKFYTCSVEHCIEEQTETIGKHVPLSNVSSQPFNAAHVELFQIEHHQILGSNSYQIEAIVMQFLPSVCW